MATITKTKKEVKKKEPVKKKDDVKQDKKLIKALVKKGCMK